MNQAPPLSSQSDGNPEQTVRAADYSCRQRHAHHSSRIMLREQRVSETSEQADAPSNFTIMKLLGKGGMGHVYEAKQTSLDRIVALKTMKDAQRFEVEAREDFLGEALIMGELEHPNIVPIHDVALNDKGLLFYAMKRVRGKSWRQAMPDLSLSDNLDILLKVADAVSFAHSRQVLHRDLKPENVMLGDFGEVLVTDWGLALTISDKGDSNLFEARELCGTPIYMAPEMARSAMRELGPHSDIYLLGGMLYELVTGQPPRERKAFWDCIQDAIDNIIQLPGGNRGELIQIALKAMETRPKDRYGSVRAFQQAIRDYREHAASIKLSEQACQRLDSVGQDATHALYVELMADFKQALRIWPDNTAAANGLDRAILLFARYALDRDETELAAGLLHPAKIRHAHLLNEVKRRQQHKRRRHRRLRWLATLLGLLSVGLTVLIAWQVHDYYLRFGQWELVYEVDLRHPDADLSGLDFNQLDHLACQAPFPRSAEGMALHSGRMIWVQHGRLRQNVRLEVDLRWPSSVDGVELLLNSRRAATAAPVEVPAGYSCQFGAWGNTFNFISRNEVSQAPSMTYAGPAGFYVGRAYRLAFQREDDVLSLLVNGRVVLSKTELAPLDERGLEWTAVRAWGDVCLRSIKVYRLGLPHHASPLVAGHALFNAGHYLDAVHLYKQIADDFRDEPLEESALAHAFMAATRVPANTAEERQRIMERLRSRFPRSSYLLKLEEADCLSAWRMGRHKAALKKMMKLFEKTPHTSIALDLLAARSGTLSPDLAQSLLHGLGNTPYLKRLDIRGLGATSLQPLAKLNLEWLDCSENALTNLNSLRGMPLYELRTGRNHIRDLAPLHEMPLRFLRCDNNRIESLAPLAGMPLCSLHCNNNMVRDLTPLAGTALETLNCAFNAISNLDSLAHVPLTELHCQDNAIASLAPLRTKTLTRLYCDENLIDDLTPLTDMSLITLHCSGNAISNLAPIANMPLIELQCQANRIGSLEPLRGSPLRVLAFGYNTVSDLSPLKGLLLEMLRAEYNQVTDLTPLRDMPLTLLDISGNRVRDLAPLTGMPLKRLNIAENLVNDLSPLDGMDLDDFNGLANPLKDLAPFERQPPKKLDFGINRLSAGYLNDVLVRWEKKPQSSNLARRIRLLRAFEQEDRKTLLANAIRFEGRRYLLIPRQLSWKCAVECSRRLGGRPVTLAAPEQTSFIAAMLEQEDKPTIWLGLELNEQGHDRWLSGELVEHAYFDQATAHHQEQPVLMLWMSNQPIWRRANEYSSASLLIEWPADD